MLQAYKTSELILCVLLYFFSVTSLKILNFTLGMPTATVKLLYASG